MEILYTTVIKGGKIVLRYACSSRDLAINFLFFFSFPHKGYSYAIKQSIEAKNDCSNISGSGEYSWSAYSR